MSNYLPAVIASPLPWDSSFFGFKTGRIGIRDVEFCLVERAIRDAKEDGYRLIYLSIASESRELCSSELEVFGKVIDVKVTFVRNLSSPPVESRIIDGIRQDGVYLKENEVGPAGTDLEQLAILSGTESRFFKDPGIPIEKAQQMYRIWINKCTEHVLADSVIIAYAPTREIVGFITVKHGLAESSIGLFAVKQQWQGQGIGSQLLGAVADRTLGRMNGSITVATQGSNLGACATYLKNGYKVLSYDHLVHIWL